MSGEPYVLAGRESEIESIVGLLGATDGEHPRLVLIEGVPGVGKTALAREVTARARERGYTVAWGHLHEDVRTGSYKLWSDVCRDWFRQQVGERVDAQIDEESYRQLLLHAPELVHHLAVSPSVGSSRRPTGDDDPFVLLLRAMEKMGPTLVILDNLHLAPAKSIALAYRLLEDDNNDLPLTVATSRVGRTKAISKIAGHRNAHSITLGNLNLDQVRDTVQAGSAALADSIARHLFELTEGVPVLLTLLLDLIRLEGSAALEDEAEISGWDLHAADYAGPLLRRRLRSLSIERQAILKMAAALGAEFDVYLLARCAGQSPATVKRACRSALDLGLFSASESEDSVFRFSSPLTREAILRSVSPAELARSHESIAGTLEQGAGGDPADLQFHLLRSFSEEAIRRGVRLALSTGAAALERFDWSEAQKTFRLLLAEYAGYLDAEELAQAQYGAARSLLHSGDKMRALPFFNSALEHFRRAGDTQRMIELALEPIGFEIGDRDYFSIVRTIREEVSSDSPAYRALTAIDAVGLMQALGDFQAAWETFSSLFAAAERSGDSRGVLYSTCALAYLDVRFGRVDDAVDRCEMVLDACSAEPDAYAQFHAHFVLTQAYLAKRDSRSALIHAQDAKDGAHGIGDNLPIAMRYSWLVRLRVCAGDWDGARRYAADALSLDRGHPLILGQIANVEHRLDNFAEGDRYLDELIRTISLYPSGPYLAYALTALTITARNRIRGDGKYLPVAREITSMLLAQNSHPAVRLRALMAQGMLADAAHDTALSREVYARLLSAPRLNLVRDYRVEHVLGILAAADGNCARALSHLESAATDAGRYPDLPATGWLYADIGSVRAMDTPTVSAREAAGDAYRKALAISNRLGMLPLREQMEKQLTALEPDYSPFEQPEIVASATISHRERQVLLLVAEGMSDKEIARILSLSVHTVANHVRHILSKIGVPNRVMAVRIARQEGLV